MSSQRPLLSEGWYLMSVSDLEIELARVRDPSRRDQVSGAEALSVAQALRYRDAGNLPDAGGRSLRLVLEADGEALSLKRLRFEPDYHDPPTWKRPGSKPVNVVPLVAGVSEPRRDPEAAWWDQPDVADLENEWRATGMVAGVRVPGDYRGFVLKTVASLSAAGAAITVESIVASLSRWLAPDQVAEIRAVLERENR